ncbi:MAG: PKD domain-containing protein [Planctomycetota bacterium]
MTRRMLWTVAALFLAALVAGCDGSNPIAMNQSGLPRLGELWQMVQDSSAPDTDGDYLPDDVEGMVGTDPTDRDTDRDGLTDNFEIFGYGYFDPDDFVPDLDNDGNVAPVDGDDDGDGINDGEVIDTDEDGVANYLEYYGYTYDWMTGCFLVWNGDPGVEHWFTDPIQWSTDQDAFSDGMEVSGEGMDPAVEAPGNEPLVPASPNIVVELQGYAVTLNEDITYTEGGSLAKGSTWNRETSVTNSRSTERSWEVGMEAEFSTTSIGVTFHANYGESYTNTQTTSTAVSVGGSVLDEQNWSRARSMNPTDAARIKLFLKVRNYGTACVSNIIPTLTLRIGGLNVATFEAGNAQINMLVPGAEYPTDQGVHWVVDSIDTGTGITPLSLTMDELRALERGAPVNIAVTQVLADVMLMDGPEGGWTRAGDCNEYLARCDAVGANLRVEVAGPEGSPENGSFVHYLVYADDTPSAPEVTLGDALRRIGLREDGLLAYYDTEGNPRTTSLENYTFVFDQQTLIDNGWDLGTYPVTPPYPDFPIEETVLGPDSSVYVKAPRDAGDAGPVIHYANVDPPTGEVRVCASDYQGIDRVEFVDKDLIPYLMTEELADTGFFFLIPDPEYVFDGSEKVVVTNVAEQTATRGVDVVFYPQPAEPVFNSVLLDLGASPPRIYANITNPSPQFPIQWVKVFHPLLGEGSKQGYLELGEPVNAYEDPDGWDAALPMGWTFTNLKLVAFVGEGFYAEHFVSQTEVEDVLRAGTVTVFAQFDWTDADEWRTGKFDADTGGTSTTNWKYSADKISSTHEITHWCTQGSDDMWRLTFNTPFAKITEDFEEADRELILNYLAGATTDDEVNYDTNDVYVFETSDGDLAAFEIVSNSTDRRAWPTEDRRSWLKIKYVVYSNPRADAGSDQDVVVRPTAETVRLNGSASVGATSYLWSFTQYQGSSEPALTPNATTATPEFVPAEEGVYKLQLKINNDSTKTDDVVVNVSFPTADAGDNRTIPVFYSTDDPIALDGTGSAGADTWEWDWDSSASNGGRPAGSTASLSKRFTATPEFTPDEPGDYVIKLVINPGKGTKYEHEATVTITVQEVK